MLLNVDYRILAGAVVRRLARVMEPLIGCHQVCSVQGREIHALSYVTRDIIEYTKRCSASGILVSLDEEKAFDRHEHGYIMNILEAFWYPHSFVCLIKNVYEGIQRAPTLDRWESTHFPLLVVSGKAAPFLASCLLLA